MFNNPLPPEIVPFMRCGKCCRVGHSADDYMAQAHCVLDTNGYKHAQECEILFVFFTATMFV